MGQSLLQTDAGISKRGNFITDWDRSYRVEQALLQSRAAWRYYKVGQELFGNWGK